MSPKVYGRRSRRTVKDDEPSPKRQKIEEGARKGTEDGPDDDDMLVPTRPSSPMSSPGQSQTLTRTPSAKPNGLSHIFAPLHGLPASPSPSRSGKSIAKRMLVRSRTDPTLPSLKHAALSPSLSLPVVSPEASPLRAHSPSPSRFAPRSSVRTYSQTRSFLVALPAPASLDIRHVSVDREDDEVRESYTDLRTRWGVDNFEDHPHHVPGIANDLMSMSELRSKGESRRFLDEVGYLFEGLQEPGMSIGVKRSTALEIVSKMCYTEFVRKAMAADFIARAWDAMRFAGAGDGDKVLDLCLGFFVALVARNRRDIYDLSRKNGFFDIIISLLQTRRSEDALLLPLDDSIKCKKVGLTKPEIAVLINLRNIISTESNLFSHTSILSTRLLASFTLASLSSSPSSLPSLVLPPLLTALLAELAFLHQTAGQDSKDRATVLGSEADLEHINNALQVLDAFLLSKQPGMDDIKQEDMSMLGAGLVTLCKSCLESALRVLINLTHSSVKWCAVLLDGFPVIIRHIFPCPNLKLNGMGGGAELDRRCLALGVVTNVVFGMGEAGEKIREIKMDPKCTWEEPCARGCVCALAGRYTALDSLLRLFVESKEEVENTPELTFFRSHLAALLCLLSENCENIARVVSPHREEVKSAVEGFLEVYGDEEENLGQGEMVQKVQGGLSALGGSCVMGYDRSETGVSGQI